MLDYEDRIYQVSELTREIRGLLETAFVSIRVEGEVSNFRPSSTGHFYFTLKDRDSMLSAVMFKNRIRSLSFDPADGMRVVVRGSISVYPQRGTYQIICEQIDKSGEGDILLMLEERKKRLAAEGLFDLDKKRGIPPFPTKIVVITSPTGAAIRDILQVLRRRNAGIDVVILPAPVQGAGSGDLIAEQIKRANRYSMGDVIIVGRGGGSLEDLLPFSEESIVRAAAESEIPLISAVGHETDTTLIDFAADYRAPTPSAAAEVVSHARDELLRKISVVREGLEEKMLGRIENIRVLLSQFTAGNLERTIRVVLQPVLFRLDDAKEKLVNRMETTVKFYRHRLNVSSSLIESLSPFDILKKGYAVVTAKTDSRVVTSAESLRPGDEISIKFHTGEADASIKKIITNQKL